MLNDGLISLVDAQIYGQKRCPVCKELLGIPERVRKVVFSERRLGKGRVHQIVRRPVHPLQEVFCVKLVVRCKMQHLGGGKLQAVHILIKLPICIIPKDQLPRLAGELGIQFICNLF